MVGITPLFHGLSALQPADQVLLSQYGRGISEQVSHDTVQEAFESIVDADPTSIAARQGGAAISYGELECSANRLANHLISLGLQPRQRVCLVVQRSFNMLVGIFAVLKAGGQYVPIDGGVSSDQALAHIFTDTAAPFILYLPKLEQRVMQHAPRHATIVPIGDDDLVALQTRPDRPSPVVGAHDGAYAIYTSGSTGRPKGVDVMHKNVVNALTLEPGKLGIGRGSRVGQVLNIAFDMGAWEILACLMNGGTLHLRGSQWVETLKGIDTFISTPTILSKYRKSDFPNIKTIVTGGEPCSQSLADEWAEGTTYYNICGPTEITILNSAHKHVPGRSLSIGQPIPNTNIYILDEDENPVSFGTKGVMWVGGAGVTKGYINLPELTASRYRPDKFCKDGSVMFNTGDIVKWRPDGCLDTFGRKDHQVKIKGFRVELDGVSAVIEKFPGVNRACAVFANNKLHGFYATTQHIDENALDKFVRNHLPYYSIPEKWFYLSSLPLTSNGKVDRSQLASIASPALTPASTASNFSSKDIIDYAARHHDEETANVIATSINTNLEPESNPPDLEKGLIQPQTVAVNTDSSASSISEDSLPPLPEKNGFRGSRWLRHRAFILYRRFFTLVVLANVAAACVILYRKVKDARPMLANLATATATNLCMAVLLRTDPVVNLLFTVFCSVPKWLPLAIRKHSARIYHIGGIHSSCAIAATIWFTIFTVDATIDFAKGPGVRCISIASIVLTYLINVLLIAIASTSQPNIRAKLHDVWELTHRFGGWTVLALLWAQTFVVTNDIRGSVSQSEAFKTSPPVWLLTVTTMAIIFPWLHLKKIPVRSEVLSNHAVRLHFDYASPVAGSAVRLAAHPLRDWHGFATITNANGKNFSVIVSNAGDFTKHTIQTAPTHIWKRGVPTCGVIRICTTFKSVVLVATGSGIGPCLAVILAAKVPCRILWAAPNPEQTFGREIMESVLARDPKAVIHDTRTMGKPNMPLMAWRLYKESGAEAVVTISNKRFTNQIVYALESRGVPAYGALFDS